MGRAPCCEKKGLKRGRWAVEEDEILVKYIEKYGEGSWKSLPKNAGLLRCGKSCRLRWINYLRADLKRGNISTEEEEIIIKLHSKIGNRWSLIAAQLPGRTDNEIKNYWNSHLSRRLHYFHRLTIDDTFIFDFGSVSDSGKRRGGRTSRASMMKNSVFMLKANGSTIKGQSLKQNQTSHNIKGPDNATSSSALKEKECRNPNFDFDMKSQNTAVEMKGKIEEEEEEEEELAAMEGDELGKVMAEMEKVLMADLEEAKLWEDVELEVWPWLWEMTGEGGSLDDESLDVIW